MANVALWASAHPHLPTFPQHSKRHLAGVPTPRSCPRVPVHRQNPHMLRATFERDDRPAPFRLENYWQCQIVAGGVIHSAGTKAIQLKLLEGSTSAEKAVTMYIGVWEYEMIQNALSRPEQAGRPLTYDLLGKTVAQLGHKVVSVVIDTLEGNSFCSTVLLAPQTCPACEASAVAHKLDARPTDAINLALRTRAPVYFSKELAARHARPFVDPGKLPTATALYAENTSSISKSVKALLAQHKDPHITARLQMALAIAKEDYKTAASLRDNIRRAVARDRLSVLVIAMESALLDNRHQEAASLRDQYIMLRGPVQTQQQKQR